MRICLIAFSTMAVMAIGPAYQPPDVQTIVDIGCGEVKLDSANSHVEFKAKLPDPNAYDSEITRVYYSSTSVKPAGLSDIDNATTNSPKTLIFNTSWVEDQAGNKRNKMRIGFAELKNGQVKYFYQEFAPEQLISHENDHKSAYTMPYFNSLIEGQLANDEDELYAKNSAFATNMLALYQI